MLVLHIVLPVKEGKAESLEQTFANDFRPAISAQNGFHEVQLLKAVDDATKYCLVIEFESEEQRQAWVDSDLHQTVWQLLANNCVDFLLSKYNSV